MLRIAVAREQRLWKLVGREPQVCCTLAPKASWERHLWNWMIGRALTRNGGMVTVDTMLTAECRSVEADDWRKFDEPTPNHVI